MRQRRALFRALRARQGLTSKTEIRVGTTGGVIVPRLESDGQVTVDMGVPVFEPARVPFVAPRQALTYHLDVGDRTVEVSVLSMGNPHAVKIVPDIEAAAVCNRRPAVSGDAPRRTSGAGRVGSSRPRAIAVRAAARVWRRRFSSWGSCAAQ